MCFLPSPFAGYAPALPCTETNYSIKLESPQSTGFCLFTLYFITSNHEHFLKDELLAGWRLEPNRQGSGMVDKKENPNHQEARRTGLFASSAPAAFGFLGC